MGLGRILDGFGKAFGRIFVFLGRIERDKLLGTKLWGLGRRGADQQRDRETERADLILWKTRETVAKLWVPLTSAALRARSIASQNRVRLASLLEAIFNDFGNQNGHKNRCWGLFFSRSFSNAFSHRILLVFWKLRTLKIELPPRREHDFHKTDVFEKVVTNGGFWLYFRMPKWKEFDKKSLPKICYFRLRFLYAFLLILVPFWMPKIFQKSQNFERIEVQRQAQEQYCFRAAFWMDFESLGAWFRSIFRPPEPFSGHCIWRNMCEAFQVEELALRIRATRGRSIDR